MRTQTNRLFQMMDEGLISAESIVEMCLGYMSEDDVADMMRVNDILDEDEDDSYDEFDDNTDDGDALASAGFGTDEDYGSYGDE